MPILTLYYSIEVQSTFHSVLDMLLGPQPLLRGSGLYWDPQHERIHAITGTW